MNSCVMRRLCIALMGVIFAAGCSVDDKKTELVDNPAYSDAVFVFKYKDNREETKKVKLARQEDGAWRAFISRDKLNADKDLKAVDIVVPACEAKKGEDGFFINTRSMLGTYRLDNGSYSSFGGNHVAFFGAKNPRHTWVAIVKGLNLEFSMVAEAKNGEYKIFPRFEIERMEGAPAYEDAIVDFYELPTAASYPEMAKKYRQYQLARGEIIPLKQRIKNNPKLERLAKSIVCRVQHGGKPIPKDKNGKRIIADQTLATEPKMNVAATCQQATDSIKLLKKYGCDYVDLQEVGWNIRGHDGRYPQLLPVEPAIGGEEKLKETVETAKKLGYNISAHVNHTDAYRIADCWSEDYIARRADGSLMYVGCWAGGKAFTPCPKAIFELFPKKDYLMIRDRLGFNGIQHVDVISAIAPRVCHDSRHPLNRRQWSDAYLKIMKYGHDVSGGFTSECGFDHVIKYLDWAFYINHSMRLPKMFDRFVPTWQLVYHGAVPTMPFFSDTGFNMKKDWPDIRLRMAEYGSRPVYYGGWLGETNIANYVKPLYDEYQKIAYLQMELMEDHKQIADGVFQTTYANGDRVVVNYNDITVEFEGKPLFAKDYRLIKK